MFVLYETHDHGVAHAKSCRREFVTYRTAVGGVGIISKECTARTRQSILIHISRTYMHMPLQIRDTVSELIAIVITEKDRQVFVVSNVLNFRNNYASSFLEDDFIAPRWIELLQFFGDPVVLAGPNGVHHGQLRLFVDSIVAGVEAHAADARIVGSWLERKQRTTDRVGRHKKRPILI